MIGIFEGTQTRTPEKRPIMEKHFLRKKSILYNRIRDCAYRAAHIQIQCLQQEEIDGLGIAS